MTPRNLLLAGALGSAFFAGAGCGSTPPADPSAKALTDVKAYVQQNLDALSAAVTELQTAAPAPDADGWNATADRAAVDAMRASWRKARVAYEHVEGAIAVLFPELDASTDERYDGFLSEGADDNLFDDKGVTGIHGIERILWADAIPPEVKTFEEGLVGYKAAAFPATAAEATDFKSKLCARLVADVKTMRDQFAPLALDTAAAYRGVIGSMNEQIEKVDKAATGEEESRYARYTLADMRANVEGGVQTYAAFSPWVLQKGGADLDAQIKAGFKRIQDKYASYQGDTLPAVPPTWSSMNPTATDLTTPFGQLFQLLKKEADPAMQGLLVNSMNKSADLLGIPQLPE
jgi:iron uptake system component EfeO